MSHIVSLTKGYGSFFWNCTKFSIYPYTKTFSAIAGTCNENDGEKDSCTGVGIIAAAVVCGILTFVVPILPALTAATFALSSIGVLLAVASMFATYPIAILTDCFSALSDSSKIEHHPSAQFA